MNNILLISVIGDDDFIALKFKDKLISKKLDKKDSKNDQLLPELLDFLKKNYFEINEKTSILVNLGPGSFSSLRISLSIAKGMRIVKKCKIFGFKNEDLKDLTLKNLDLLIRKKLLENELIKPIYLS